MGADSCPLEVPPRAVRATLRATRRRRIHLERIGRFGAMPRVTVAPSPTTEIVDASSSNLNRRMRRVSVEFNANTRFEFNIEHVDGEVARVLLTKCMDHLQTVGFSGLHNLVVTDADGGELRDDDLLPEGGLTEDGERPDIVMVWRHKQVHL